VRAPPEQTPKLPLLFHGESILSIFAVVDGNIAVDWYPISKKSKPKSRFE